MVYWGHRCFVLDRIWCHFIAAQAVVATGRGSLGTSIYYSAANTGQLIITIPAIVILKLDELQSVILALALGTR